MIDVPASAEQLAFKRFVDSLRGRTVAAARDAWDLEQDGTLTVQLEGSWATVGALDTSYDDWAVCRVVANAQSGLCAAFPVDGYDVTVLAFENGCPSRGASGAPENTFEYIACPACSRLYFTGTGATPETMDPGWDSVAIGGMAGCTLSATPTGTAGGGNVSDEPVNLAAQDRVIRQYQFSLAGDMLSAIQAGGTFRLQMLAVNRQGIGIDEESQQNFWTASIRVLRAGSVIGTATAPGTAIGGVRFPAQSGTPAPATNRSLTGTLSAIAGAQSVDLLVVEVGWHHVAPTSGGTGVTIFPDDSRADDLPMDDSTTATLNSWIDICG